MAEREHVKQVAENRQARHEYFIDDTYEAGLALTGTEVKSIRLGRLSLRDGYAEIRDGEAWLVNVHISPYDKGNRFNQEPLRRRKLLLHRSEIRKLHSLIREKGLTLVPLSMYFKDNHIKVTLAVARGKKQYDKRDTAAKRDTQREIERAARVRE